jgi:hypothetical protein
MSNANTIASLIGGTQRNQIPALVTAATTATIFTINTDSGTPVPAILSIPSQTSVLGSAAPHGVNSNAAILVKPRGILNSIGYGIDAPYFNSSSFDGRAFKIRLQGTYSSAAAANQLTLGLYLGSSATVGSDLLLGAVASGATTIGAVTGHFLAEGNFIWDSASTQIDGTLGGFYGITGGQPAPTAAVPAYVTHQTAANIAALQIVAAATWTVGNAANTIQVTEFSLEMV